MLGFVREEKRRSDRKKLMRVQRGRVTVVREREDDSTCLTTLAISGRPVSTSVSRYEEEYCLCLA